MASPDDDDDAVVDLADAVGACLSCLTLVMPDDDHAVMDSGDVVCAACARRLLRK